MSFSSPITLITGNNGSGKTSIVEALYYLSYFKSFRTSVASDLMYAGSDCFFLKGHFTLQNLNEQHAIQVGYGQRKKSIKLDQKVVGSFKDVLPYFQVVTLTEDDIDLIKGSPSGRRSFIDQAVLMAHPETIDLYRDFRQILQNRNMLLERSSYGFDSLEFEVWTKKLWESSSQIQAYRQELIQLIQKSINDLIDQFFDGVYEVCIEYEAKIARPGLSFEQFSLELERVSNQERYLKRSMFGAHLDDLVFHIRGKKARIFASRGQQKLISLLCKLSLTSISGSNQVKPLLLIDDFISDFDKTRLKNLIDLFLSCKNQIIMTAPFFDLELQTLLAKADPDVISLIS